MEIKGIWYDGISGQIRQGDIAASLGMKPYIPGVAFDQLIYDPSVYTAFKVLKGRQTDLTNAEREACAAFIETFMRDADYPVYAWDELHICLGQISRKEAEAKGYGHTLNAPDHPASKWSGSAWVKIKAAITDAGTLKIDPDSVCGRCVLVFSEDEWAAQPKPDPAKPWLKWDFVAEAWKDQRDFAQELYTTRLDLVSNFEHLKIVRFGRTVTEDELRLWSALADGSFNMDGLSPLLDREAFVASATAEKARYEGIALESLMERETWLVCLKAVTTLEALDALRTAFRAFFDGANRLGQAA